MSERFFSATPITTDRVTLAGAEAHHLAHVMRVAIGDRVTLFDGSGNEFVALVEKLARSSAELRVVERHEVDRELPFTLVVGVALPKGDRQKWLVEKLTELGTTMLVPLMTKRGVARPTAGAIERLDRAVIEAAKQCGRNRLMQIMAPQDWEQWIAGPTPSENALRVVAHPGGESIAVIDFTAARQAQISIGPEGGLTDSEIVAARAAGWRVVALGPRLLRVETAAVALATIVSARMPLPKFPSPTTRG
jgi:16S rRNA (uracil1498-N3)-methyltransferase